MASAQHTLVKYYQNHNQEFFKRIGVNREKSTAEQYEISLNHLIRFLRKKSNVSDVPFTKLDLNFIEAYDFYLRVELKRKSNTILDIVRHVRKMIKLAIVEGIIYRDPFVNYVLEQPLRQRRHLTMDEFQKLLTTPMTEKHLEQCWDMFLFACFSGMAYADVCNLSEKHITQDDNGIMWIKIERQKTKSECRIKAVKCPNSDNGEV